MLTMPRKWHQSRVDAYWEGLVVCPADGEGGFSRYPCESCGRPEGGDRYPVHAFDPTQPGETFFGIVCIDCLMYIVNNDILDDAGDGTCDGCDGSGRVETVAGWGVTAGALVGPVYDDHECPDCGGTGVVS